MNAPLWFSNLLFWSAQVAIFVLAAALLLRVFQIHQPRILLAYWRVLFAVSLALPFLQPWHRPKQAARLVAFVSFKPVPITAGSNDTVAHWHLPSVQSVAEIVGAVIFAGIIIRLVVFALGLLKLRQLRKTSMPIIPSCESALILEAARTLLNSRAEFRLSARVDSPVTFGFFAPVILLPERFQSIEARFQSAIACHELLHVRRRDWAHHLYEEILRAAFWFNPSSPGSSRASASRANRLSTSKSSASPAPERRISKLCWNSPRAALVSAPFQRRLFSSSVSSPNAFP